MVLFPTGIARMAIYSVAFVLQLRSQQASKHDFGMISH